MKMFGIMHHFKGGTQEQYEKSLKAVHPATGLPPGQTTHIGCKTADGFLVVALFDDEASWVTFRDTTLMPRLATVEGGLEGPPEETELTVVNFQTA